MAHNNFHDMQHSQHELSDDEMAELQGRLSESPAAPEFEAKSDDARAEAMGKSERFLSEAPLVSPSPGFADRVMAAIAALPLPEFARRNMSLSLALGLLAAVMLVIPVLVVAFVMLLGVIASPAAWGDVLRGAIDAAGYLGGLLMDIGDELDGLVSGTAVLPALLGIVVPLLMLWGWVLWQLMGKGRGVSPKRQKP